MRGDGRRFRLGRRIRSGSPFDQPRAGALLNYATAALTVPSSVEIEGNAYTISYIGTDAFNGLANFSGTVAIPSSVVQISGRTSRSSST